MTAEEGAGGIRGGRRGRGRGRIRPPRDPDRDRSPGRGDRDRALLPRAGPVRRNRSPTARGLAMGGGEIIVSAIVVVIVVGAAAGRRRRGRRNGGGCTTATTTRAVVVATTRATMAIVPGAVRRRRTERDDTATTTTATTTTTAVVVVSNRTLASDACMQVSARTRATPFRFASTAAKHPFTTFFIAFGALSYATPDIIIRGVRAVARDKIMMPSLSGSIFGFRTKNVRRGRNRERRTGERMLRGIGVADSKFYERGRKGKADVCTMALMLRSWEVIAEKEGGHWHALALRL